jgi:hypothetical protein
VERTSWFSDLVALFPLLAPNWPIAFPVSGFRACFLGARPPVLGLPGQFVPIDLHSSTERVHFLAFFSSSPCSFPRIQNLCTIGCPRPHSHSLTTVSDGSSLEAPRQFTPSTDFPSVFASSTHFRTLILRPRYHFVHWHPSQPGTSGINEPEKKIDERYPGQRRTSIALGVQDDVNILRITAK